MQWLVPVAAGERTLAAWHQAVIDLGWNSSSVPTKTLQPAVFQNCCLDKHAQVNGKCVSS